jgi:phosphoglycolate phosphatase
VDEGLRLFLAYNEAHIADRTVVYPGVRETLPLLAETGRTLAIVSNKNAVLCRTLLATLGIDRFFPLVLGADSTPSRKPSPEPLLAVMEQCGARPDETVMVGDSINDIAAGRAAGVATVGCSWGYAPDELGDATCRIDAFADLATLPLLAGRDA